MAVYLGNDKIMDIRCPSWDFQKAFFNAGGHCGHSTNTTSFVGAIAYDSTSDMTDMSYFFEQCTKLKEIPSFNTSKVTNMISMFSNCSNLTTIPQLDTSNVTNMGSMFSNCTSLASIPQLDTSKVTNMVYMFSSCSSLTTIPQLDTSKVTNMGSMFYNCTSLASIPQLDTSKVTNMVYMFERCTSLTSIKMKNMSTSFDIHWSTKMEREALVEVLNNLATVTSTKTLTLGSTLLAKLTDTDKAIATNKGWTLA